jgi:hypothetical protein
MQTSWKTQRNCIPQALEREISGAHAHFPRKPARIEMNGQLNPKT